MAQRFGRNQRRRAREALRTAQFWADLNLVSAQRECARAELLQQEVAALRMALADIHALLGTPIELDFSISECALHDSPIGWLENHLSKEIARHLAQVLSRRRPQDAKQGPKRAVRLGVAVTDGASEQRLPFDEIQLRRDQQGRLVLALRLKGDDLWLWYDETLQPGWEMTLKVEGDMIVKLHNL